MKLGYSHSVFVSIPEHIKVEVPIPTKIVLSCTDKHQLGLFAAQIRRWRPPEPYKGKVRGGMLYWVAPFADSAAFCRVSLWAMRGSG